MTLRPIITLPDEKTLRQISRPVAAVDAEVRKQWDDMLETMYHAPGIGLAAIQIGLPRRLLVIDLAKDGVGYAKSNSAVQPYEAKTDELRQQIIDGTITVPEKPATS